MTRDQLKKYVGELSDGAVITICESPDQVPRSIRLSSETIQTEDNRWITFIRGGHGLVIAAWIFAASMFPNYIPQPDSRLVAASSLIGSLDFTFSQKKNESQPFVQIPNHMPSGSIITGASYYIPSTAIQPSGSFPLV